MRAVERENLVRMAWLWVGVAPMIIYVLWPTEANLGVGAATGARSVVLGGVGQDGEFGENVHRKGYANIKIPHIVCTAPLGSEAKLAVLSPKTAKTT